jgi:hypothetical protein
MKRHLASLAATILMLGTGAVRAQEQPAPPARQAEAQSQAPADQPGVARLSFIHGNVSSQRGDNGEWVAATLNTPIVAGDRVSTGQSSRAELQLDWANILRLSENATANVVNLERNNIRVQVGQGLVTYSVLRGGQANSEIDTPNAAVRPLGEGEYRIQVNSNDETQVIVRNGSADVSTPQGSTHVERGQLIIVAGTDNPQYRTESAPGNDEWDSWNDDRNRLVANAESWRHTDRYYVGSHDLDANGTWTEAPDYGQVWVPRVDPGWAPYRAGRWVWEPYYGWTWVSYEPWGWAPYHYGRWFVYGSSWAWWPGPVITYPAYYPIWSPAYVSFFGFGGGGWGFGVGFGGWGNVGWLPCGPGDWYHPWYGRWGRGEREINVTNIYENESHEGFEPLGRGQRSLSNVHEALRNERVRAGMSSMAANEFGRAAVSAHQGRISDASFRQSSMLTGKIPVTPTHGSYSPTNRAAHPSTLRNAGSGSERFFSAPRPNSTPLANNPGRAQSGFGASRNGGSFEQGHGRPVWRTFTPPQPGSVNGSSPGNPSNAHVGESNRARGSFTAPTNRQWTPMGNQGGERFIPPTSPSRGGNSGGNSNSYRPPLNMRQPIVTPRGGSSYGYSSPGSGSPRGYSAPSAPPSYSAPRGGGYSGAPHGGPSYGYSSPGSGSPRGYSAPSAPPSYSAPRGGGYSSAPRGGPSGGGSRGGGGANHSEGGHSR